MKRLRPILWLLALLPVSCARDAAAKKPAFKPFSQRIAEDQQQTGKNPFVTDANGNLVPRENKRSSFETKGTSAYFKGEYDKKEFKTADYLKKSWWGNKDYGLQQYAGKTDGSRFQTTSRLDGKGAREAGTAADIPGPYHTENYATNAAREASAKKLDKPANAETENRRGTFQQPEIVDWREQRSLSIQQSKGILGR